MTIDDMVLGLIALAVPLLVIGFLALRRLPAVFAFFVALVAVGLGYLTTTGAVKDVGGKVRAHIPAGVLPTSAEIKVDVTPPAMPKTSEPAPAPAAPASEPATPPPAATEPPPASTSPAPANP